MTVTRGGDFDQMPRWLAGEGRAAWRAIDRTPPAEGGSQPEHFARQPEPIARWLQHSAPPGTPRYRAVRLAMHGEIRLGRWLPFSAEQVLAPAGFVWAAKAGRLPLRISGFDCYLAGEAQMRWKLFGVLSVMSDRGDDVSRSAAGRFAGETMLIPTAAADLSWRAVDHERAIASIESAGYAHEVEVAVDHDGRLATIDFERWGKPDKGGYGRHRFGVEFTGEATFDGVRIPSRLAAGWWHGTDRWRDGEFFRATIDHASFR